jgi:metallo-beta-lactamase family protein
MQWCLTHAHLDHSGYLPLLAKEGFAGAVLRVAWNAGACAKYCYPTVATSRKKTLRYANRHGFSKHAPALPLYTRQDALDCLPRIKASRIGGILFNPFQAGASPSVLQGIFWGRASLLLEVAGQADSFFRRLWGARTTASCIHPDPAPAADTVSDRINLWKPSAPGGQPFG